MRAVKVRAVLKESVCLYKNEPNYNLHSMSVVVRRCYSSERRIPSARSHLLPGGGESPSWTVAAEGGPNSTEKDGLSVTMLYDVVQNKDSLVYHCHIVLYSKNEPTSCKTKIIKEPEVHRLAYHFVNIKNTQYVAPWYYLLAIILKTFYF